MFIHHTRSTTTKQPVTRAGWIRMGIILGAFFGFVALKTLIWCLLVRANKRRRQRIRDHNALFEGQSHYQTTHAPLPPATEGTGTGTGDGGGNGDQVVQPPVNVQVLEPFVDLRVPEKDAQGNMYVTAVYDYTADGNLELTLREGDCIRVTETTPEGWWLGELNGVLGWFPGNYCGPRQVYSGLVPAAHPELDELIALAKQNAEVKELAAASMQSQEMFNDAEKVSGDLEKECKKKRRKSIGGILRQFLGKDVSQMDEKNRDDVVK